MKHNIFFRIIAVLMLLSGLGSAAWANDTYTVVIDAGHGGKDHGAIDNNVREKDINLGVALKVGELIKKQNKNIKVVYTRDKDTYLTLQQRADKANKAKGDLFISIHTNSVDKSNPNRTSVAGASTYTLGLHKESSNMDVARRENSVMTLEDNYGSKYSGFDPNSDESYIIFEMAQKANMTQSTKFAKEVQRQLTHTAKRTDRGVHQAGFWVLWATSMPSVLVELDFICNPNSAKYLASEQGQKELAQSIANATTNYFKALSQHKKNRLKAKTEEENTDFSKDSEGVTLASSSRKTPKKTTPAPQAAAVPGERTRQVGTRRRRSDASREKSERHEYAVAVIQEEGVYIVDDKVAEADDAPVVVYGVPSTDNKNKKKTKVAKPANRPSSKASEQANKKNNKKDKQLASAKSSKESQPAKPAPAKANSAKASDAKTSTADVKPAKTPKKAKQLASTEDKRSSSPARLQKSATVYKIQIFSSPELLKANSAVFCGLTPVTCIKEANEYKYLYGESTNRNEIYQLLAEVQKDIPDASIVTIKKSMPR